MTVRPILKWPDPRLSQTCDPVADPFSITGLVQDLFNTMYAAPGRGLAAPQIGVMQRVFVMDPTWKDEENTPFVCINPEVLSVSEEIRTAEEVCLSIPAVSAHVSRSARIEFGYTDLEGTRCEEHLCGFAATCAQHEFDHLNGQVIFDHLAMDRRNELESRYKELV